MTISFSMPVFMTHSCIHGIGLLFSPLTHCLRHLFKKNLDWKHLKISRSNNIGSLQRWMSTTTRHRTRLQYEFGLPVTERITLIPSFLGPTHNVKSNSRRTWIGNTSRQASAATRATFRLGSPRQRAARLDSGRSLSYCHGGSH